MEKLATFMVVGGGIAGVTCIEQLLQVCEEEWNIVLLTSSSIVKSATNVHKMTKLLEDFDVEEKTLSDFSKEHPQVSIIYDTLVKLDAEEHKVHTSSGQIYRYRKMCLCTGGRPKVIKANCEYVLGIRDTETVKEFQTRLSDARRLMVVGNGGIATEIVYAIDCCEVIWSIKDRSIGATFFDCGAAEFFLPHLIAEKRPDHLPLKRHKYDVKDEIDSRTSANTGCNVETNQLPGVALGPDWSRGLTTKGKSEVSHEVHIEYGTDVAEIFTAEVFKASGTMTTDEDWPVYVELSNGKIYGCDFVISATGVIPNTDVVGCQTPMKISNDGGIEVNEFMETSLKDVYAAGDVCSASWPFAPHWLQMRLWTQARQMGAYAAKCMTAHHSNETVLQDFCFEIFTHVTKFFGFKVILLGLYNAQGLGNDYNILLRVTKGVEYIKVVMQNGKMQGAVLVGETDLEETFENLILNQMDLSVYGEDLLNPNVDIDDYFD